MNFGECKELLGCIQPTHMGGRSAYCGGIVLVMIHLQAQSLSPRKLALSL